MKVDGLELPLELSLVSFVQTVKLSGSTSSSQATKSDKTSIHANVEAQLVAVKDIAKDETVLIPFSAVLAMKPVKKAVQPALAPQAPKK